MTRDFLSDPGRRDSFLELVFRNPFNRTIADALVDLEVDDVWLVAGCLFQTVWNIRSGRPAEENIKDYDVFYYDASDVGYDAEDRVIRRAATMFADLPVDVEVRNQARVHLWYEQRFGHPIEPLRDSLDGISGFLVAGSCVGIGPDGAGGWRVAAPFGLDDMFDGVLRPNRGHGHERLYQDKAASYAARWPWLTTLPWQEGG